MPGAYGDEWRFESQEILEVMFAAEAAAEAEDLRRDGVRVDLDIVAWAVPQVTRPAQKLVRLKTAVAPDAEVLERQGDHAGLSVVGVDVDDGEDNVGKVGGGLGVGDQLLVLGWVEPEAAIAVQGRVFNPDFVDQCDQLAQAVRAVVVPLANLILLGVQVFLRTGIASACLAELERRPVDAVARAGGGSENEARHKRRAPAALQVLGQDVGGVGPKVWPEVFTNRRLRQLGEVLPELRGRVGPREIGVRLR